MPSYRTRLLSILCFLVVGLLLFAKRHLDQRNAAPVTTGKMAPAPVHPATATSGGSNTDAPAPEQQFRAKYPAGVPAKFTPDGKFQPFAGNTIVCHLPPSSPVYQAMLDLYTALDEDKDADADADADADNDGGKARSEPLRLRHLYTLLPPSSWHMTVFEGVCDQVRTRAGSWPPDLPSDAPLAQCHALFSQKLANLSLVAHDDGDDDDNNGGDGGDGGSSSGSGDARPPYRMRVTGFSPLVNGIGIDVEPATAAESARLRRLRDRFSSLLGLRRPQHDTYALHLSVAYLLRHLDARQEGALRARLLAHGRGLIGAEFTLGAPEFCTFETMAHYERLFYLGENDGGGGE